MKDSEKTKSIYLTPTIKQETPKSKYLSDRQMKTVIITGKALFPIVVIAVAMYFFYSVRVRI